MTTRMYRSPGATASVTVKGAWTYDNWGVTDVRDDHVADLVKEGWSSLGPAGPSSARPTAPDQHALFFDTTLGKVITWQNGWKGAPGNWIDPLTGAGV